MRSVSILLLFALFVASVSSADQVFWPEESADFADSDVEISENSDSVSDAQKLADEAFASAFSKSSDVQSNAESLASSAFDEAFGDVDIEDPTGAGPILVAPAPTTPAPVPVAPTGPVLVAPAPTTVAPVPVAPTGPVLVAPAPTTVAPVPVAPVAPAPSSAPGLAPVAAAAGVISAGTVVTSPAPATGAPAAAPAPACSTCGGFSESFQGHVLSGGIAYIPVYNVSHNVILKSSLCSGNVDVDLDLCLQEYLFGSWYTRKCSSQKTSDEAIEFLTQDIITHYRWEVSSNKGAADFTLCHTPSSCESLSDLSSRSVYPGCNSNGHYFDSAVHGDRKWVQEQQKLAQHSEETFQAIYDRIMGPSVVA